MLQQIVNELRAVLEDEKLSNAIAYFCSNLVTDLEVRGFTREEAMSILVAVANKSGK